MKQGLLGKTGLQPSKLSFGASPLGNEFGETDEQEGRLAVQYAIEEGINYFDVAPYYGRGLAEERLGKALKPYRDKVILATKIGRYDKNTFDFSAARVHSSFQESLNRLNTDYIDLLQVHDIEFADLQQIIHETLPAMLELKQAGAVRFVGITGYGLTALKTVAEAVPEIDTLLSYCRYDLLDTSMDQVLTPIAQKGAFGLINASPLHMRLLTNAGAPDWHPAPKRVVDTARQAVTLCKEAGLEVSQVALQFALGHPYVATTLVGMKSRAEVKQNLQALAQPLARELLERVQAVLAPVANLYWQEGRPENFDPGAVPKHV